MKEKMSMHEGSWNILISLQVTQLVSWWILDYDESLTDSSGHKKPL